MAIGLPPLCWEQPRWLLCRSQNLRLPQETFLSKQPFFSVYDFRSQFFLIRKPFAVCYPLPEGEKIGLQSKIQNCPEHRAKKQSAKNKALSEHPKDYFSHELPRAFLLLLAPCSVLPAI